MSYLDQVWRTEGEVQTHDATATTLLSYNLNGIQADIPSDSPAMNLVMLVIAKVVYVRNTGDVHGFIVEQVFKRVGSGNVTNMGILVDPFLSFAGQRKLDAVGAYGNVILDANNGTGIKEIRVRVTGVAGATIDWKGHAEFIVYGPTPYFGIPYGKQEMPDRVRGRSRDDRHQMPPTTPQIT